MINLAEEKETLLLPVNKLITTGEIGQYPLDVFDFNQWDYIHRFQLEFFRLEKLMKLGYFEKKVNDVNYAHVTHKLKPGVTYRAERYPIYGEVSGLKVISFMEERGFLFAGAQGLSLIFSINKSFFSHGVLTVSFDYEKQLYQDRNGEYQVPGIYVDSPTEICNLVTENFHKSLDERCELLMIKEV